MRAKLKITGNRLSIGERLGFEAFETWIGLIPRLVNQCVRKDAKGASFDFSQVCWADLMELMCLPVAADWVSSAGLRPAVRLPPFKNQKVGRNTEVHDTEVLPAGDRRGAFVSFCRNFELLPLLQAKRIKTNVAPATLTPVAKAAQGILPGADFGALAPEARFLPIRQVTRESLPVLYRRLQRVTQSFLAELTGDAAIPNEQRESLCDKIIFELCENALLHAYGAPDRWPHLRTAVLAARAWRAAKSELGAYLKKTRVPEWLRAFAEKRAHEDLLEICLVDGGIGIYRSLLPACAHHASSRLPNDTADFRWSEHDVVRLALSDTRLSSLRASDPIGGLGLHWMYKHVVEAWKGCLYLRTGSTRIVAHPYQQGNVQVSNGLSWFPGTQFRIWLQMHDNRKAIRLIQRQEGEKREECMRLFRTRQRREGHPE